MSPAESDATAAAASPLTSEDTSTGRRIAGAALIVMVFFVLSRITGLAREVIIGALYGTSAEYDAYLAAFRVPDLLFQLVAGGALGSAFIPVFSAYWIRNRVDDAWLLFSRVLNLVTVVLVLLAGLAMVFALPLVETIIAPGFSPDQQVMTASLMRIMLLGTIVFGASGLVMAALNATQHFLWPAAAPVVYNLSIIGAAWLLTPRWGVYGLAVGVVVGAAGHFLVQLPQLLRTGARYTPEINVSDPGVLEVMRLMGPRLLGLFFVQMHFLVNTILASSLAAGSLSALNYAWLLMLLPLGIFSQSVATAAFPTFSAQVAAGDVAAMRHTLSQTLRTVLFLVIPSAVVLIVFGEEIVALLLERGEFGPSSTAMVASALAFYAIGLMGHASLEIIVRAFYALHDTWTPVIVGICAMGLNIGLSLLWVDGMGFAGLALANSTATSLEAVILFLLVHRKVGGLEDRILAASVMRTVAASACMGVVLYAMGLRIDQSASGGGFWVGLAALGLAFVTYAGVSAVLRHPELNQVQSLARRGRR